MSEDFIGVRWMAYFALSFDHRVIDGADAERFLAYVKELWSQESFRCEAFRTKAAFVVSSCDFVDRFYVKLKAIQQLTRTNTKTNVCPNNWQANARNVRARANPREDAPSPGRFTLLIIALHIE